MTAIIGWAEGTCSRCGKTYRLKRLSDTIVCDCHRICPLCGAEMTPFNPSLNPGTYGAEEGAALKGQAVESPAWTTETVYVCHNHSPPYYSSQKPVEVKLS
jgi:hypothetical protein